MLRLLLRGLNPLYIVGFLQSHTTLLELSYAQAGLNPLYIVGFLQSRRAAADREPAAL